MHVGHKQGAICALAVCERLPVQFMTGLFLHEFGHLGSGGGELEADRWIFEKFRIRISYVSELDLECVDPFALHLISRAVKKADVDLRHNR